MTQMERIGTVELLGIANRNSSSTLPTFRQTLRGWQLDPDAPADGIAAVVDSLSLEISCDQPVQFAIQPGQTFGQIGLQSTEDLLDALIETGVDQTGGACPCIFKSLSLLFHLLAQAP